MITIVAFYKAAYEDYNHGVHSFMQGTLQSLNANKGEQCQPARTRLIPP